MRMDATESNEILMEIQSMIIGMNVLQRSPIRASMLSVVQIFKSIQIWTQSAIETLSLQDLRIVLQSINVQTQVRTNRLTRMDAHGINKTMMLMVFSTNSMFVRERWLIR